MDIGDDIVGQKIMKDLAVYLHEKLGVDTYYQRTNLIDEVEPIHPVKTTRKVKP